LIADVRKAAPDRHLRILALPSAASRPAQGEAASSRERSEGGVTRSDIIAGNIGYLEVVGFPPLPEFKLAIERAMAPLANARALIIDVRRNPGGGPASVSYLVSYFTDPKSGPVHI